MIHLTNIKLYTMPEKALIGAAVENGEDMCNGQVQYIWMDNGKTNQNMIQICFYISYIMLI